MEWFLAAFVGVICSLASAERNPRHNLEWTGNVSNFTEILQEFNSINETNWSKDLLLNDALIHMYDESMMTDCLFLLGSGNETETFSAHSLILSAASPVFRHALKNSTQFKISNWKPREFKKLLRLIYSGDLCFDDFDEACVLLKLATHLKLPGANAAAQIYIQENMNPSYLWQAIRCAEDAGDENLLDKVHKKTAQHAYTAIKDPAFYELSHDEVVAFLSRDDVAVKSEVEIFEAVVSWATAKLVQEQQTPTQQLVRQKLGSAILKSIRFLTMSGQQFSKAHLSSGILDYHEVSAVFLYMFNSSVVKIPDWLSNITESREYPEPETHKKTALKNSEKCALERNSDKKFDFEYYTITKIQTLRRLSLVGFQVPKSIQGRKAAVRENFDIFILDEEDNVAAYQTYNEVPPLKTKRQIFEKRLNSHIRVSDSMLITVQLRNSITIPPSLKHGDDGKLESIPGYKIKIVFRGTGEYPKWVDSNDKRLEYYSYPEYIFGRNCDIRILHDESYVYSLITN